MLRTVSHLSAAEQAFQAQGVLEQYNNSKLTQTYQFTMLAKGCRWLIHAAPNKDKVEFYVDSYDGENVYHYLKFPGTPAKNVANSSGASVEINDVPNNVADYATPIWLAYGSGCYFDKVKNNMVKPFFDWFEPTASELNKLIVVELKRSEKPPFVPVFIYAKDFNRRYRVLNFTNFNGLMLPKEFVVECFTPYTEIATNPPVFSFHGVLKSIAPINEDVSAEDFRPKLDGRTYTIDQRFPQLTNMELALAYLNKSNQWLLTNNSQLVAFYHRRLSLLPTESSASQPSRLLVLSLLVFPTIALGRVNTN